MPHIIATDRPTLWAVTTGTETLAAGLMEKGGLTVTGNDKTLVSDVSENAFLGKVAGKAGSYKPLPATGTPLNAGDIYGYGGGLVMVRQSHNRTEHAPADVPALFTVYRADAGDTLDWVMGERVEVGTRRTYGGKTWEALQAHQTEFSPDIVPALWGEVTSETGTWVSGEQGLQVGDLRTYQGVTYRVVQNPGINIWPPPTVPALWEPV